MTKTRICICGGGSLGHVCAGVLASDGDVELCILTRHPERWSDEITVTDCSGRKYEGRPVAISSNPEIVSDCDIVFLCLPGYAIEESLTAIKPYSGSKIVGSIVCSTGFFYAARRILGEEASLFGFQRTPFIARTDVYGRSAKLLGYKPQVSIAVENIADKETFRRTVEKLWKTPTGLLNNYYEASLTNSNPILHTGRLYSMWKDSEGAAADREILFYEEWTDDASRTILEMDREFQNILQRLPVAPGAIPPLLEYYESKDAESLTAKIKSIPAFAGIKAPMRRTEQGWIPDFSSRYFTEDFPFGLRFIYEQARTLKVDTPVIDKVYGWGMSVLNGKQ